MVAQGMGQRDVTDTALFEKGHVLQLAVDRRAVLHPQRQRNDALFEVLSDVLRGGGQRELAIRGEHNIFNQINEFFGCRA